MRHPFAPLLFLSLVIFLFIGHAFAGAAEPFFKKGDVISLVGGEDMVVASEYGYLELLLRRALPDYQLRFRDLACEGDTVFEQRRELNFPSWEEQLDKIGATVVIAQFGQMESLAGMEKLPEFIAAYEKLIERFSGGGKRKTVVILPALFDRSPSLGGGALAAKNASLKSYCEAILAMAAGRNAVVASFQLDLFASDGDFGKPLTRDGAHLTGWAQFRAARQSAKPLLRETFDLKEFVKRTNIAYDSSREKIMDADADALRRQIVEKNRLWFDYWRPQNWAFLAGDRTSQPSSRDHLDPSKRWFPPEREQFLPLIEAKEKEIDALAAKLANP